MAENIKVTKVDDKKVEAVNGLELYPYRYDLLPEELQFICRRCHIAANKRMNQVLACSSVTIEGRYCPEIERLRSTLKGQARQIEAFRKYASIFVSDNFEGRTSIQKFEVEKIYNEKIVEGKRSLEEFIDLLQMFNVDVVGS